MIFSEYYKTFKNTYFEKYFRTAASVLCRTIFRIVELPKVEIFRDRFIKKCLAYRLEYFTAHISWKDF